MTSSLRSLVLLSAAAVTLGAAFTTVSPSPAEARRYCLSQQNVGPTTSCFRSRRACMRAKTGNTDACTQAPRGRRHYR